MPKKPSKPADKVVRRPNKGGPNLYTVEVILTGGPISDEFVQANPKISRTIQIRDDQTLDDLHGAIIDAFDRDDDHQYGFYIPEGRGKSGGKEVKSEALISSLDLRVGALLRYHFDFGDDWIHNVKVKTLGEPEADEKYPKVIQSIGQSPPQYPDVDEEDWGDDESEENMPDGAAADVSLLIGEMHLKAGEYAKAVEAFTRSIEANPAAADEYEGRSRAYRALADEDERRAKELRAGEG